MVILGRSRHPDGTRARRLCHHSAEQPHQRLHGALDAHIGCDVRNRRSGCAGWNCWRTSGREQGKARCQPMNALSVRHATINFGGVRAVTDITIELAVGERRVLLGPNGAGKTTLFNIIGGQFRPKQGSVSLFGRNVTHLPPFQRAHAGLARTFQITTLFPSLSVADNIYLAVQAGSAARYAMLRDADNVRDTVGRVETILAEWHFAAERSAAVRDLSYGEQRKLELAMALAGRPRLLLLDEPTAGLSNIRNTERRRSRMRPWSRRDGAGHRARHGRRLCDRGTFHDHKSGQHRRRRHGGRHPRQCASAIDLFRRRRGMNRPAMQIDDIHTYYGDSYILQGLSLGVAPGETVAVLGRNGVGKTTLMRSIIGFAPPTRGIIYFQGAVISGLPPEQIARRGIALVPQGRRIFRSLTIRGDAFHRRPSPGSAAGFHRTCLRCLSAAARAARPAIEIVVRRRAADAGNRTRPRQQPQMHPAG